MNKKTAAWIWLAIVASIVLYFAAATGYLIRLGLAIAGIVAIIGTAGAIEIILDKDDDNDYL
jgi:hypothetical protein